MIVDTYSSVMLPVLVNGSRPHCLELALVLFGTSLLTSEELKAKLVQKRKDILYAMQFYLSTCPLITRVKKSY